jgi:hypothetical protein
MACLFREILTSSCPRSAIIRAYKDWISRRLTCGTREQNDALWDFLRWIFNGSFSGADNCVSLFSLQSTMHFPRWIKRPEPVPTFSSRSNSCSVMQQPFPPSSSAPSRCVIRGYVNLDQYFFADIAACTRHCLTLQSAAATNLHVSAVWFGVV